MIHTVLKSIGTRLEARPWIDVFAPVAIDMTKKFKDADVTVPVSINETLGDCDQDRFNPLLPDEMAKSVSFFRVISNTVTDRTSHLLKWSSNVEFVCWLNLPLLGSEVVCVGEKILGDFLNTIEVPSYTDGVISQIQSSVTSVSLNDKSAFDRYKNAVDDSWYLFPFEVMQINLTITYTTPLNCHELFELGEPYECTKY